MIHAILFYSFAAILMGAALGVIFSRNPVHAVMFLVLTFFQSAVLWLLAEAEFLAIVLVLVYVGAVMVLFLFVVMMLDIDFAELRAGFARYLFFGIVLAVFLAIELVLGLEAFRAGAIKLGTATSAPVDAAVPNLEAIGALLYTKYVFLFEAAGLILLVAMIGAIVLTHRKRSGTRPQNVAKQVRRRPQDAVRNLRPEIGQGVDL